MVTQGYREPYVAITLEVVFWPIDSITAGLVPPKNVNPMLQTLRNAGVAAALLVAPMAFAQPYFSDESAQIAPSANTVPGWEVKPLLTIGEIDGSGQSVNLARYGYEFPGVPDGMAAYRGFGRTRLFVNHEFNDNAGSPFTLANGTVLTGARVSYLDLNSKSRGAFGAGLAIERIFDRYGVEVTDASQLNEGEYPAGSLNGLDRLCSGWGANGFGEYGLLDPMFFTGEETSPPFDARGGAEFVLDVKRGDLYCVPMLGRAAWESATAVTNFGTDKVVILGGDDRGGAPLILYVGEKGSAPASGSYTPPFFLTRNGLGNGNFYVWVSDSFAVNGEIDPATFNGTGNNRTGRFVRIDNYVPAMAGMPGYDAAGFADLNTLDALGDSVGRFAFSRPEDVSTNPNDPTQVIMASTGRSSLFGGVDSWGTMYLVDFDDTDLAAQLSGDLSTIDDIRATVTIVYDGDDAGAGQFSDPDAGLRSPDNLVWASNGQVYVQEDRSVSGFGALSGVESSVWSLDVQTGLLERVLEIDRASVPAGQTDPDPTDIGNWENSGVIDVTDLFLTMPGETLLILNSQAHSLRDGIIGGTDSLVEGGQILMARTFAGVPAREAAPMANLRAYPNPASDFATVSYTLTEAADLHLAIYDLQGRLVRTMIDGNRHAGHYTFSVPVAGMANGRYVIEMRAGSQRGTTPLVVAH